jgi:hypothetical protein
MLKAMRDRDIATLCDAIESDIRDGSISLGRQVLRGSTQSQSGHAY